MIVGLFIAFRANFNLKFTQSSSDGPVVAPVSSVPDPSIGPSGISCSLMSKPIDRSRSFDLIVLAGFLAVLGVLSWRRRKVH
jgi:hypothetical protein